MGLLFGEGGKGAYKKIVISSNMEMKPLLVKMLLKLPGEKYSVCVSTPLFRNECK